MHCGCVMQGSFRLFFVVVRIDMGISSGDGRDDGGIASFSQWGVGAHQASDR